MGNAFRLRSAKVAIGKTAGRGVEPAMSCTSASPPACRSTTCATRRTRRPLCFGAASVATDTAEVVANICEVMVVPQPYGTIYAATSPTPATSTASTRPPYWRLRHRQFTTSIRRSTTRASTSTPRAGRWRAAPNTAQERTAAALERDYRQKIPFRLVEELFHSGIFHANGQTGQLRSRRSGGAGPPRSATPQPDEREVAARHHAGCHLPLRRAAPPWSSRRSERPIPKRC
ncbi:MAG: hypothetical protein IPK19_37960 [Chloroflexi bacterium]|nr:hypothetical protein [Chloroflexota bacterium]